MKNYFKNHSFNVQLAVEIGVDEALLFQNIAHWVERNMLNKEAHNFREGRYWTYNSQETLLSLFPYMKNRIKVKRVLDRLEELDLIMKGNFNKTPYDKTTWYTLTDKGWEMAGNSVVQNVPGKDTDPVQNEQYLVQSERPIPNIEPNVIILKDNIYSRSEENVFTCEYFSVNNQLHTAMKKAYPNIDPLTEYPKMEAWLYTNPSRQKKKYQRFINSWLSRASKNAPPPPKPFGSEYD
jgi:hypothetical protein